MSRLLKTTALLASALLLPTVTLLARQPPTATQPNEPTAKDVAKSAETPKPATDPVDRIKEEGLRQSQVMETLSYLTDVIGPRLTGSPNMKRANEWTRDKLAEWGLENAHLEPWGRFGRGWSLERFSAQVVSPQCIPLIAFPKAWSPGTEGTLVADVVVFDAKTEAEFARFKGKLKGAIVLTSSPPETPARFEPLATRLSDKDLLALADAPEPSPRGFGRPGGPNQARPSEAVAANGSGGGNPSSNGSAPTDRRPPGPRGGISPEMRAEMELSRLKMKFLADEGAAILVDPSRQGDGGTLFVAQATIPGAPAFQGQGQGQGQGPGGRRVSVWDTDAPKFPTQMVVAKEHYNRLVRMIRQGETLKMAVELAVRYHDDDPTAYNTVAEIPGTDLKDEVVMLGGHMDSWHSGTGATDNAAGVAVAMEAVRILKALDLRPRRTVRIALWTGEEQGLLGSRGYVRAHFGKSPPGGPGSGPALAQAAPSANGAPPSANGAPPSANGAAPKDSASSEPTAEFEKFSAYFNLDNGTGKVRGVYLQGNEAVRPVFRKWLAPFKDMGASTLSISNTGGTDHLSFDGIGLPGFQFIQDVVEYNTRTHHSNQDLFDRIQADDMKQAAVIMAAFVYNTAVRDEKLPRKPASR
jgi:hypothetical protein